MKTKILLLVFLIITTFISCNKDDNFEKIGDETLLKKILIDGEVFNEFTYNYANLILEEKSKYHYTKYIYNRKNQLTQSDHYWDERIASSSSHVLDEMKKRKEWVTPENTEKDVYTIFEYTKTGDLIKSTTHRINNNYTSYSTFTYNENGKIERRTAHHENKIVLYDNYFYDESGNMIKKVRYGFLANGNNQLGTTTEYEFDNMHNPYLSFSGPIIQSGRNKNPNNIIRKTYTIHFEVDDSIDKIQITEYSYEYNSNGYPTKRNDSFEYIYY